MSDTPYADRVITRLCAVCFKQKPIATCYPQYGWIGRGYACQECIDEFYAEKQPGPDAVLKQGRAKAPERGLFGEGE